MAISILHVSVFTLPVDRGYPLPLAGFGSHEQQLDRWIAHEMVWGTEAAAPVSDAAGRWADTSLNQAQLSLGGVIESRGFQAQCYASSCLSSPYLKSTSLAFYLPPLLLPSI